MKNKKYLLFYGLFFIAILVIATSLAQSYNSNTIGSYSDLYDMFMEDKVETFIVDSENNIVLKDTSGKIWTYKLRDLGLFYSDLGDVIKENHVKEEANLKDFDYVAPTTWPVWLQLLPYILVIIALVVFAYFFIAKSGKSGGGGIGKMNSFSRARTKLGSDEKHKVTFDDVAGADEEKEELQEVVEFLKNPSKFTSLGARIPKGVLLVGSPGTGKTLLAKAVAGESGVPFYSISGSDFVEMYVGVGASRVRDLFETAKKTSPCIIFIDEIDAVGRHRGAGLGGGHDEREQTLNQLLVEMDGFGVNDGVIVMAATNRPDILDPALLRPGRFDRQVNVGYPDIRGRVAILKVHSRKKPLEDGVDLEVIAKSTAGFTGADLANLLNEAALLAARRGKKKIGMPEIHDAILKIVVGTPKKSLIITEDDKRKTAYHEAGHAIIHHILPTQDPVQHISIIPSGRALGYTVSIPQTDKTSVYKKELKETIASLLGGRVAEEIVFDDISGGASNDIERATNIARKMVAQLGMSETLGPIVYGTSHDEVFLGLEYGNQRNYSEEVAARIDSEVLNIVTEAHENAKRILLENRNVLDFIAEYLVKNEVMDGEQFEMCFEPDVTPEMLDAVRERKAAESEAQNNTIENDNNSNDDNSAATEPNDGKADDAE